MTPYERATLDHWIERQPKPWPNEASPEQEAVAAQRCPHCGTELVGEPYTAPRRGDGRPTINATLWGCEECEYTVETIQHGARREVIVRFDPRQENYAEILG